MQIKQGKHRTAKELSATGGSVRLPASLRKGAVQVRVIADGAGGRTTLTRTVVVR